MNDFMLILMSDGRPRVFIELIVFGVRRKAGARPQRQYSPASHILNGRWVWETIRNFNDCYSIFNVFLTFSLLLRREMLGMRPNEGRRKRTAPSVAHPGPGRAGVLVLNFGHSLTGRASPRRGRSAFPLRSMRCSGRSRIRQRQNFSRLGTPGEGERAFVEVPRLSASRDRPPNHGIGSEDRLVRDFLLGEASALAHVQ